MYQKAEAILKIEGVQDLFFLLREYEGRHLACPTQRYTGEFTPEYRAVYKSELTQNYLYFESSGYIGADQTADTQQMLDTIQTKTKSYLISELNHAGAENDGNPIAVCFYGLPDADTEYTIVYDPTHPGNINSVVDAAFCDKEDETFDKYMEVRNGVMKILEFDE